MKQFNNEIFERIPVVGILRHSDTSQIRMAARAFYEVGFRTLEITMNSADAEKNITFLSERYPDMNIGAGTVCTMEDLSLATKAGASFVVSPILSVELIETAKSKNLAVFPGAFTPTEIYHAWQAGATAVKVFPSSVFGPGFFREILAPLPQIKLLAVGGITPENVGDYFAAGVAGVGIGSGLFHKTELDKGFDSVKALQQLMFDRVVQ